MTTKEKRERIEKGKKWRIWQWEFARHNKDVIKAYEKAKELRKRAVHPPDVVEKPNSYLWYPYLTTPEAEEERKICQELGLNSQCLIDPKKSYEDLMKGPDSIEKICFFPVLFYETWAKWNLVGSHATIDIDFSRINSPKALAKQASELIKLLYSEYYEKFYKKKLEPESDRQRRMSDFDRILKVGQMTEQGMKNIEIAKELFPDDFLPDGEDETEEEGDLKVRNSNQHRAK